MGENHETFLKEGSRLIKVRPRLILFVLSILMVLIFTFLLTIESLNIPQLLTDTL